MSRSANHPISYRIEQELIETHYKNSKNTKTSPHQRDNLLIAGIDEAGRGALAGPVVVAIVVLDRKFIHPHTDDSKKLAAATRSEVAAYIKTHAQTYAVAAVSAKIIDKINILAATKLAIRRAYAALPQKPHYLLLDGKYLENLTHWNRYPPHHSIPLAEYSFISGDSLSYSIAAASILAKVTRDNTMRSYHNRYKTYQIYNFHRNKGYGVPSHLQALQKYGATPLHRKTFSPVKKYCR
ncbi:ribonuclease HII [Spirochaetota bacterium]|nr:ribonuclease HII [Spirochaetota bacterium]